MLGAALVTQGKGAEAVEALEQVVEEDPENALARFYLGLAYRDDGEYSQAKKELETFIALSRLEEGDPTRMRIEQLVAALDQGYLLSEDKAIADLEEMLEVIDAEVDIEEGEDEAEKEGRTLVISLDIAPGEEQQSLGRTMGIIAGATASIISRVDPPIENGLLIRLEEWGQTKFTAEFALEDIRRFSMPSRHLWTLSSVWSSRVWLRMRQPLCARSRRTQRRYGSSILRRRFAITQ